MYYILYNYINKYNKGGFDMMKYTQKKLKNLVLQGAAVDITHMSDKEIYAIKDSEKWLDEIRLGSRNLWL